MSRLKLVRNLIPAVIVALVLGSSLVISAGAKEGNGSNERDKNCGYGYTQADKDENGTEHGNNNDTKAHGEDNDKCEDEGVGYGGETEAAGGDNGGDNGAAGMKDREAARGGSG